jgi:glycosyltransferase involved in cell wall biosynthesis
VEPLLACEQLPQRGSQAPEAIAGDFMRILTVCTSSKVFGSEVVTLNLLAGFKQRGFEQLAVTSTWTDGEFSKRLVALRIPEVALPLGTFSVKRISWTLDSLVHAPQLWRGWNRTIKGFQPDVLLLTNPKQGIWIYSWLDRQPSFLVEHGIKVVNARNRWMYIRLQRKLARFVAVSRFMAGHLQNLGIAPEMIRVIYNGSPFPSTGIPAQPEFGSKLPLQIGIVGQISPHKGHDLLLGAAKLLKEKRIDFEVVVFGSGDPEYICDLNQRIKAEDQLQQWRWMGYLEDHAQMYRSMDVCVVPSRCDEAFGMVALEASSYGIPVVAARRGGLPEIVIHGETGLLADPENPVDLAEKLALLARNRDLARRLGQSGRERALCEFTQECMVSNYENLFRGFVTEHLKR